MTVLLLLLVIVAYFWPLPLPSLSPFLVVLATPSGFHLQLFFGKVHLIPSLWFSHELRRNASHLLNTGCSQQQGNYSPHHCSYLTCLHCLLIVFKLKPRHLSMTHGNQALISLSLNSHHLPTLPSPATEALVASQMLCVLSTTALCTGCFVC